MRRRHRLRASRRSRAAASPRSARCRARSSSRVPPVSWMLYVRSSGPSCRFCAPSSDADLVRLAAEPDHQHAGEIGVPRVAAERAAQELHPFAVRIHPAAGAVRQRDDAVDVREASASALAREMVGDAARRPSPSSSPSTGCRGSCASRRDHRRRTMPMNVAGRSTYCVGFTSAPNA